MINSSSINIQIIVLAIMLTFSPGLLANTLQVDAYHEMQLRSMGIGFNDYDGDGVTCAATDYQANLWSDPFYNHHNPNINQLIACENKEASYAGLPDYADNLDHMDNLNRQYDNLYGPNSGWADSFGTFGN